MDMEKAKRFSAIILAEYSRLENILPPQAIITTARNIQNAGANIWEALRHDRPEVTAKDALLAGALVLRLLADLEPLLTEKTKSGKLLMEGNNNV
jgi:hypothetical protein